MGSRLVKKTTHVVSGPLGEPVLELSGWGAGRVLVGLRSATMDGALGMARAFGWVPRGRSGRVLPDCGDSLAALEEIQSGEPPPVSLPGLAGVRNRF